MNHDYYDLVEFNLEELRQKLADERHEDGSAPTGAPAYAERILDFISLQQEQIVGLTNLVASMQSQTEPLPCATCGASPLIEFGSNKLSDTSTIKCSKCTDCATAVSLKQAIETWNRR